MTEQSTFLVAYDEELKPEDREAFQRRGWQVFQDGIGTTAVWRGDPSSASELTSSQVIKVPAPTGSEAVRLLVDTIGRSPENVRALGE